MKINYGKLHNLIQLTFICVLCLSIIGIFTGLLQLALLMSGISIPEAFVGILAGWLIMPRFVRFLSKLLLVKL